MQRHGLTKAESPILQPLGKHVFTSRVPWRNSHEPVLIMYCSDPRFRLHFIDFTHNHLSLIRPVCLTRPGGPATLLSPVSRSVVTAEIQMHAHKHGINRCIGIEHSGLEGECSYHRAYNPDATPEEIRHRQEKLLRQWRDAIAELVPAARNNIELYFVDEAGGEVRFFGIE